MKNGKDFEVGSAMLKARIIDIEKARGTRVREFPNLKPVPGNVSKHRTLYFIFSGFKRHWIRMTGPGPEAA
jgi:hypothetical protein